MPVAATHLWLFSPCSFLLWKSEVCEVSGHEETASSEVPCDLPERLHSRDGSWVSGSGAWGGR